MRPQCFTIAYVVLFLVPFLVPASSRAQEGEGVRRAQELHDRGVELYRQERYREAIEAFTRSDYLVRNPVNQWNIMRCYEELGEPAQALRALDRYLAMPDLTAEDRRAAERRRVDLQRAVRETRPEPPPPTPPVEEGPNLAGPWAVFGTGLGLMLAGVGLYIGDWVYMNPDEDQFGTYDEYEGWYDGVENLAIAADVLTFTGAAATVVGLIWLLVARSRGRAEQTARRPVTLAAGRDGVMIRTELVF